MYLNYLHVLYIKGAPIYASKLSIFIIIYIAKPNKCIYMCNVRHHTYQVYLWKKR